ncbi:MAG: hypothetical protein AAGB16_05620 [Pseudomonadota bacterium]
MTVGPKTYAPLLATCLVLWPIAAYSGAQGFTGVVAVAALISLFYVRVRSVQIYVLAFLALVVWIIAAGFWAPEAKELLTGNLLAGSFSMDMAGVRFGLTALAGLGLLVAVGAVPQGTSKISLGVIVAAGLVQFMGVIVTALFMPQILALLAPVSDPVKEMPQNLIRNANAFSLLLPFLVAWLWHRGRGEYWALWAVALFVLAGGAFMQTSTQTASMGAFFMLLAMAIVKLFPKHGFKMIFTSFAAYIVAAPTLLGWGLGQIRALGLPLPKSFFSRTYSWELVHSKVGEAPLKGHGLEATQTWQDTYGDHPAWLADAAGRYGMESSWEVYRVIPTHPHNMPLQIWAETGMIGAILAAVFLFFVGWRLKAPEDWPSISRYAAAGLAGICFAICSFAYSMWNEAFWASVVLAAAVILLQARHDGAAKA